VGGGGKGREKEVRALDGSSNLLDAGAQARGVGVRALAVGLVRIDKAAAEIFDWMRGQATEQRAIKRVVQSAG